MSVNGHLDQLGSNSDLESSNFNAVYKSEKSGSLVSLNNGFHSPVRPPGPIHKTSNLSSLSIDSTGGFQNPIKNAPIMSNDSDIDVVFIDPLERKYACSVCDQVLRYPVQFAECSHHCCSSCLPELLRVAPRCPIDQSHIDREKVYVNKEFQKEIDNLGMRCSFFLRGCIWTGILKELAGHLENCLYRMVICPLNCNLEFEARFMDQHKSADCLRRVIQCQFCETTLSADIEAEHLKICGKFPIPCPNGCKKKEVLREDLAKHLESKCSKQEMDCPFGEFGCDFRGKKKKIREHLNEDFVGHLTLTCEAIKESTRIVEEQSKILTKYQTEGNMFTKKIDGIERVSGPQLIWRIDNYQEKFTEAKTGKKTTIFSNTFQTSPFGYKLGVSACLYGDGKARTKYLSIFICICKGDYDSLLTWPFSHRITFTLIDQCQDPEARKNIIYTVKPNTCKENSPFLARPTSDRNASFGAQKFAELDILGTLDYIRDDVIFIKVLVDTDEMIPI